MGGHHKFDPAKLHKLKNPERLDRENPEILWEKLALKNPVTVLDIGGGIGFAAIPFARKMPDGLVWVCDISPEMLKELEKEAAKEGTPNVRPLLMGEVSVPLPDGGADGILMQNLHHELKDPVGSLKECFRLLRTGGRVEIVDWRKTETPGGPPVDHRVTEEDITGQMKEAGLTNVECHEELPYHYLVTGEKG